ncbi:MAG: DUF882 domain-containing protein [Methylococcaceae bacterium]|nr:DUF882 domain-containing protein [Methylococcaceae bacterium]MCI0733937.1 DUF882 domain-containing protein [Methylococcaceae bacterium]
MNVPPLSRRSFLCNLAGISAAGLLAAPINAIAGFSAERRLNFLHTHTKEKLDIVYFSGGNYLPDAMSEIRNFLRDHRTDETHPIDPALFDILHTIRRYCPGQGCFQVISGYRSPATNHLLRRKTRGVARKSLHMQGKAIDVRLPDISTRMLRNLAVALQQGGVGYYRKSDFVHIDTGRVRTW